MTTTMRRLAIPFLIGLAAVACGTDDPSPAANPAPTTSSPSASPSPVASSASPTPAASLRPSRLRFDAPLGPDDALAVTRDGRLVAFSATDGRVRRELGSGFEEGSHVDRSPDGSRVYYTPRAGNDCKDVVEVVAGSGERVVGPGCVFRVSPDGRLLAAGNRTEGVTVYDLADPAKRTTYASYGIPRIPMLTVWDLTWMAGGTRLAVQLSYEGPQELRIVDPATHRSLRDGTPIQPEGEGIEAVGPDLVVVRNCCTYGEDKSGELVVRNGADGRTRVLARSSSRHYQAAADGSRLLYVTAGTLYRWDGGTSSPVRVGRLDALALAW